MDTESCYPHLLKKHIGQWEHRGEIFGTGVTLEDSSNAEERHLLNLGF